jgi:hypothetical protein
MTMLTAEVYKNIAQNGPLSDANALARWNALNDSISNAIVDESARWGDALASTGRHTYTKSGDWINATQAIANDLQARRRQVSRGIERRGISGPSTSAPKALCSCVDPTPAMRSI